MSVPLMLDDLSERFREKTRERLEEMTALLDILERHPPFPGSLERLARHFHALAGLGSTYGYPEVSRLGDEAEAILIPLVRQGQEVGKEQLKTLRELAEGIAREVK